MIDTTAQHCPEYELAWKLAEAAKDAGNLALARAHYAASGAAAQRCGADELVERALCNEAAVAIALGEAESAIPAMREVLMHNQSQVNCYLASYNIARAYELSKDHKKGLFYARIARDRAELLERPQWLASAWNQIANFLLGDSFFRDAADTYRAVLADSGPGPSLRTARRHHWSRSEMIARIDLCYAHLEIGRLEVAERHGRRGLALAEESGETDWVKNALYLLGEVAVVGGAASEARTRFGELQQRFYPEQPYLSEFLVGVDVRRLVNLRA